MTREEREQAIAILENEKKCVNRANKNDYCNRDCYNCELVKTDTEILTAFDMAIKALEYDDAKYHEEHGEVIVDKAVWEDAKRALEQEPIEVEASKLQKEYYKGFEDCRQAVLNILFYKSDNNGEVRLSKELRDRIKDLPPVNPQPKGHWIDYDCNEDKYDKIKCSECGHSYIVDSYHWCDIGFTEDDLKYCPHCGARMESEI